MSQPDAIFSSVVSVVARGWSVKNSDEHNRLKLFSGVPLASWEKAAIMRNHAGEECQKTRAGETL